MFSEALTDNMDKNFSLILLNINAKMSYSSTNLTNKGRPPGKNKQKTKNKKNWFHRSPLQIHQTV